MSENMRRWMSKWDVIDDPQILGPTRTGSETQETNLKSDQNYLAHDREHFYVHADKKDEIFMKKRMPEANGLRRSSSLVESIRPSNDKFGKAHFTKLSDFDTEKTSNQPVSRGSKSSEIIAESDFQRNETFGKRSDDWRQQSGHFLPRGWSSSRRSKSISRSRSRSRSWSRSRSRSPISLKHGSDAWSNRGRKRTGKPPACRDFAAGHCRRGSHCRFLHDEHQRTSDRPYDEHLKERRFERARNSGYDSKEKLGVSRNQADHIRDKPFQRYGNSYNDRNLDDSEMYKNNKSTELCHDFVKGRCQRGSSCRYLHQLSLHGERSAEDDDGERTRDMRGQDSLYNRKFEPRRANDVSCKFFAEGRCSRGKSCRFSHHEVHDGLRDVYQEGNNGLLRNASNWDSQAMSIDTRNPSKWSTNSSDINAASSHFIKEENSNQNPQHMQSEANTENGAENRLQDVSNSHLSSLVHVEASLPHDPAVSTQKLVNNAHVQQQSHKISVQESGVAIDHSSESQVNINSDNTVLTLPSVPEQSLAKSGQAQFVVSQRQNNIPNVQVSHIVAQLPLNGPIRQTSYPKPPTVQNQLMISLSPSNPQNFNLHLQNPSMVHPVHIGQTQQKSDSGLQLQQNASLIPEGQTLHDLNLNDYNSCFGAPPMHGEVQQNSNKSMENPRDDFLPFQVGQGQQTIQSLSSETQNASEPPKPGNNQISSQKISVDASKQITDTSEENLSSHRSDNIVSGKVVSSEQAEKITNLSVSLARFFGNAALSATASGMPQQPVLNANPAMLAPAIAPTINLSQGFGTQQLPDPVINHLRPVKSETSNLHSGLPLNSELVIVMPQTGSNSSFQMPVGTKHEKPYTNEVQPGLGILPTKGNETKDKNNHETNEANDQPEEDSKQNKDAKAMRVFKCVLVEFVKDILKPVWKEGQLSKEVHKTIVKKVVEKVTNAMQGPNLPRSQEKVDLYLAHSKPKLSKLVQAYVEKYGKN